MSTHHDPILSASYPEPPTDAPAPAAVPEWQRTVDRCLDKLDAQIAPPASTPAPAAVPCPECHRPSIAGGNPGVRLCPVCNYIWAPNGEPPASTPAAEPQPTRPSRASLEEHISTLEAEVAALRADGESWRRVAERLEAEKQTALARVAQLEALVQQVEWRGGDEPGVCPWCEGQHRSHFPRCPAFGQPSRGQA